MKIASINSINEIDSGGWMDGWIDGWMDVEIPFILALDVDQDSG
jgi:hypothetical protein